MLLPQVHGQVQRLHEVKGQVVQAEAKPFHNAVHLHERLDFRATKLVQDSEEP